MCKISGNNRLEIFTEDRFDELISFWKLTAIYSLERQDTLAAILKTFSFEGILYLIISEQNKIIGTSWITIDGRRAHIHHFAIHPNFRRRGYATWLAEKSCNYATDKGYQIRLDVEKHNSIAQKIYKRLGFFAYTNYDIMVLRKF